jgi:hypothetical protein
MAQAADYMALEEDIALEVDNLNFVVEDIAQAADYKVLEEDIVLEVDNMKVVGEDIAPEVDNMNFVVDHILERVDIHNLQKADIHNPLEVEDNLLVDNDYFDNAVYPFAVGLNSLYTFLFKN